MAEPLRPGGPGGLRRLDWLLTRYWDEAEADLAFRGVDLLAEFQACRVRFLLNVVLNLPKATLTQEAMSQDDELVEQIMADRTEDDIPSVIRWSEFTPEVEALYGVADRLGDVVSGLVGLGGKKPPRIPALKRPVTAWSRVKHRHDLEQHRALVRRVLPDG